MAHITNIIDRELKTFNMLESTRTTMFIKYHKMKDNSDEKEYKVTFKRRRKQYTFIFSTTQEEDSITPYDILSSFMILTDIDYKTFCDIYQIKDRKLYNKSYKQYKRLHALFPDNELEKMI